MAECISCSSGALSESHPYLYKSDYFRADFPNLIILKCDDCGLLQVDHDCLSTNRLTEYYANAYRQKAGIHTGKGGILYARGTSLAALAKRYSENREIGRIFELGSGYGYNLEALSDVFPAAELLFDELDENAWAVGRQASITDGPYDVILMSHVLEHLVRPKAFIARAYENLTEGGILVVEVPNESKNFVYQFSPEGRFHEPHITFFSKESLGTFFTSSFSEYLSVEFLGSAGALVAERDSTIERSLHPSLKSKIYRKLSFAPGLQRGLSWLYRGLTGKLAPQEIDLTNNSPDGSKVFLRIILRRM